MAAGLASGDTAACRQRCSLSTRAGIEASDRHQVAKDRILGEPAEQAECRHCRISWTTLHVSVPTGVQNAGELGCQLLGVCAAQLPFAFRTCSGKLLHLALLLRSPRTVERCSFLGPQRDHCDMQAA